MKPIAKRLSSVLLALLAVGGVVLSLRAEGPISLSARVDRSTITIGDLITYSVTVVREKTVNITWPALGENLGGFEIRDYQILPPRKQGDMIIEEIQYVISTFETGEFEIPPIAIRYSIPPDSTQKVLKTESIPIRVESLKPSEEGDIKDLKPPQELPVDWQRWLTLGGIIIGTIFLVALAIFLIRKRRRGEAILPQKLEPGPPPHIVAIEELEQLASTDLLAQGQVKAYFTELSEIIRRYLEGRFQIVALELTTAEILEQLGRVNLEGEVVEMFAALLERCDLVKFAKYLPTEEEISESFSLAREIIERTAWRESMEGAEIAEEETGLQTDGQQTPVVGDEELDEGRHPGQENKELRA